MRYSNFLTEPEILDLTNKEHIYTGGSHGNLIKYIYKGNHIKTGRKSSRENPNLFSIEPVIERVCYKIAKIANLSCADQHLSLAKIKLYNDVFVTIVNVSQDYNYGDCEELSLIELVPSGIIDKPDFNEVAKIYNPNELIKLLTFDYIILNEDRHNGNISWFIDGENNLHMTPVYDSGYSLLYDDIKGLIADYKNSAIFANCNSDFYQNSFYSMELFIKENSDKVLCLLEHYNNNLIFNAIKSVETEYMALIKYTQRTVKLSKEWFDKIHKFVTWRVNHVRDICLDVENQ